MEFDQKRDHLNEDFSNDAVKKQCYRLIVDPQIKKGQEKLVRYNGESYSTENHGQGIVVLRDPRPRMNRLWSRRDRVELPVPRYKVDEWYVGAVPPREVTFSRLNDNITKQFMEKLCLKFGKLERVRVYHHPKTQKHMGLSKVVFSSIKAASECVKNLHMTSIMGNVIHAQIDCKGEILNRLFQKIVKGEILAETIPDVIRHTQDGITMSNKFKDHHRSHSNKKERRKSSQDDPRKLRKSFENKCVIRSSCESHGPKTPPSEISEDHVNIRSKIETKVASSDINAPATDIKFDQDSDEASSYKLEVESKDKEVCAENENWDRQADVKRNKIHVDEHTMEKKHARVWSSDLESRISSLLSKQTKKYKLDEFSQNDKNTVNNAEPHNVNNQDRRSHSSPYASPENGISRGNSVEDNSTSVEVTVRQETADEREAVDYKIAKDPSRYQQQHYVDSLERSPSEMNVFSVREHRVHEYITSPDFINENVPFMPSKQRIKVRRSISPQRRNVHYADGPPRHPPCSPDGDKNVYSPHYHRRHREHMKNQYSPHYERRQHQYTERRRTRDFGYADDHQNLYSHLHSSNFEYRRHKHSPERIPHSPRQQRHRFERWRSPERYPEALPRSHHHHHSASPPRMSYYSHSRSRERSPTFHGRTYDLDHHKKYNRQPSPESNSRSHRRDIRQPPSEKHRKELGHSYWQSHSPGVVGSNSVDDSGLNEESSPSSIRRKSDEVMSPKISLDQRLKEMTGETVATEESTSEIASNVEHKDSEVIEKVSIKSDSSSVDMEISEGESMENDLDKANQLPANILPKQENMCLQRPIGNEEMWKLNNPAWTGFDSRVDMAQHQGHPRVWDMPNMAHPQGFYKGFPGDEIFLNSTQSMMRFPQKDWEDVFPHRYGTHPGMQQFSKNHRMSIDVLEKIMKDDQLAKQVLSDVVGDLKQIVSRDLNRKIIESMAFKVYEAWWDENANKQKQANKLTVLSENNLVAVDNVKQETAEPQDHLKTHAINKGGKMLLNAFDPLNWAKNSFEMDGFRIGLGLRSAISKMPSFRVKKRPRTPTPPRQKFTTTDEDVEKKKKQNKENEDDHTKSSITTKKYHRRISALDSEGEEDVNSDENESETSLSDRETGVEKRGRKYNTNVLHVEDVFSESSETSDDSQSDLNECNEESSEVASDSEDEDAQESFMPAEEKKIRKRKLSNTDSEHHEDDLKKSRISESECYSQEKSSEMPQTPDGKAVAEPLASLLSPTAPGVTGNTFTPEQLRHIHPKKRHRVISQEKITSDGAENFRSDDELSFISDKEKAALEALTDMQMTPDRRLSSQSSDLNLPTTPGRPTAALSTSESKKHFTLNNLDRKESLSESDTTPHQELEAVEALLSIRKSLPPVSPPTDQTKSTSQSHQRTHKEEKRGSVRQYFPLVGTENKAQTAELAEEHNYFAPSFSPKRIDPNMDPVLACICEEHNYSQLYIEEDATQFLDVVKGSPVPVFESPAPPGVYYQDSYYENEVISAAEHAKLRREESKRKHGLKKSKHVGEKKIPKVKYHYPQRDQLQELIILYDIWNSGVDLEDLKYLREVYEGYLEKSNSPSWVNDSHWVPYPVTNVPDKTAKIQKRQRRRRNNKEDPNNRLPDDSVHLTGSARTEGFYELGVKVKLKQRRQMYGETKDDTTIPSVNHGTEVVCGMQNSSDKALGSRETRHFMRRIASEVGSDAGDLFKYNQLMFRKKAVKFKRSSIHGWGLFAEEDIGADEMVIEYVGQVVRSLVAERREEKYTEVGIGSSYLFRIDSDHIIDATKCGNYARFMNHSCNPSCYAKVITVDMAKKIVIYSKGPIKKTDEITYDYKFPLEDDKIMCYCGAENCRRTLN